MKPPALETLSEHVDWAAEQLTLADVFFGHGCDNATDEAIWCALHTAGLIDCDWESVASQQLSAADAARFRELIRTRIATRKPLAYLLNEAWFAQRPFYVDERAIVPRSHIGDFINDQFTPWVRPQCVHSILDLCTGSGCIAVALALAFPNAVVDACDIDAAALEVAHINVERYQCAQQVKLIKSNLFAQLDRRRYDLIVTNPPYVSASETAQLPPEYRHEPQLAITCAEHGLALVKQILRECSAWLADDGFLVMELGNSAPALERAFPKVPFMWLTSESGESVVLIISAAELACYGEDFASDKVV